MKVTESFIECLKKANNINQSLRLIKDSDSIRTRQENKTAFMVAPVDVVVDRDVNIYDLREFIAVLGLIENPVLDLSQDNIVFVKSEDGKQKLRYIECEADMVSSYAENDPKLNRVEMTLDISEEQFASVVNAAKTMNLPYIGFMGDGDRVYLTAFNKNAGDNQDTNSYAIDLCESPVEESFNMYFNLNVNQPSVLSKEGELTVSISSKPKAVKVETATDRTFFLAFDSKSEFGQ